MNSATPPTAVHEDRRRRGGRASGTTRTVGLRRTTLTVVAATLTAAALALAAPLTASAHVQVVPNQATPGSEIDLTFKVPTESATAGTVKLEVDLPTKNPFTSVSYEPVEGWTTSVVNEKLAKPVKTDDGIVTEAPVTITWTANPGVEIAPGAFQEFVISAGLIPDVPSVELPAHQTYSDGTVVNWDQKTPASGVEPEHPAPTLYITAAPPVDPSVVGPSATSTAIAVTGGASSSSSGAETIAIVLGLAALLVAAAALVIAVLAFTRRRSPQSRPAPGGVPPYDSATPEGGAVSEKDSTP